MNHLFERTSEFIASIVHRCIAFNARARMPISPALIPPINPAIISGQLGNRDLYMRSPYAPMTTDNVSNYSERRD